MSNEEKSEELREKIIGLINEYSEFLSGYEIVGVVDVVKHDCHTSIQEGEENDI